MSGERRSRRLKGLPISRLIPNMMTVLALCAGLTAIRFGYQGHFERAAVFILIAGVLDGLDGRMARLLGGASKFGAELDSLSDFLSFGVAPAMILYFWAVLPFELLEPGDAGAPLAWVAMLVYAVCASLRLARFNTMIGATDQPSWAYRFFTGVPAPAAALLALMPIMASFALGAPLFQKPFVVSVWAVFIGLLMVSRIPTFSLKGLRIPIKLIAPVLVLAGLVAALLLTRPWPTLTVIGVGYLILLPVSLRDYNRRLQADEAERGSGDSTHDSSEAEEGAA